MKPMDPRRVGPPTVAPTPAERAARRWLLLMGAVMAVIAVATAMPFLSA
jgi:hypothetical protein